MAYANDLIVVFLALELLSIPLYVLAGFAHPHLDSEESSLKYFLLGTFAAAFVLYGTALIYGASGHTDLTGIIMSVTSKSILSLPLLLCRCRAAAEWVLHSRRLWCLFTAGHRMFTRAPLHR